MDGNLHTSKSRLVAKGYTQNYGVVYGETFSPVANIRAIRILLAIVALYDYEIWQVDVKTAYLNGHLSKDIYMMQPEGFVDLKHPNKVCKLQREAAYILGIEIIRDRSKWLIAFSQSAYLEKILKRFWMENSKKGYTPMIEKPDYRNSQGAKTPSEQNPGEIHWTTFKSTLKYLRNTKDMVLVYGVKPEDELKVSCYTDASFQIDKDDTKSQMGYVFYLMVELWTRGMRKFIDGLGSAVPSNKRPMEMLCDNELAIAIANDHGILKGAKHFQRKYHYIREVIQERKIILKKVHTDDNVVDPFTKPMLFNKHYEHAMAIGIVPARSLIFLKDDSALSKSKVLYGLKNLFPLSSSFSSKVDSPTRSLDCGGVCSFDVDTIRGDSSVSMKIEEDEGVSLVVKVLVAEELANTPGVLLSKYSSYIGLNKMSKSSLVELVIALLMNLQNLCEQKFRSFRKLFKTLSLDESRPPVFDLFSDLKENSDEEVAETMAKTMEEYMSKTRADYGSKYCPLARTTKKIEEINNFQKEPDETFYLARERFKELLMKCPQHYLTEMQEVILVYNGLKVPTRQILDSKGVIPTKTAADAKVAIQEMAEYSQKWHNGTSKERKQTDVGAMINSIENGDHPLPVVAQVSLAGTTPSAIPTLKDPKFWTAEEKKTRKIDHLWDALERQMRGSEYAEQDRKAAILYEYETFKAIEGEQLLDTYLRYLQVINDLKKCGYKKDNCELNYKFLKNLQPEWK
uniref:Reverse transcriptase Ty1/copia-type domain-containing protein n=1 Tax=Tanacetum cinerariifolium TaxID=118510 RepID=A0A699HBH0_TANCI|nr:hypothetical protein [Tanacetum cinerariifolium]